MAEDADREQKTEPATPKRRQEARSKGAVARSQELTAAVLLTAGLALLTVLGSGVVRSLADYLRLSLGSRLSGSLDDQGAVSLLYAAAEKTLPIVLLITLSLVGIASAASYWQVGFQINTKAIQFNLGRLNPAKGLKSLFHVRSLVRVGASLVKAGVILAAAYFPVRSELGQVALLDRADLMVTLAFLGGLLFRAAAGACAALVCLGVLEFLYEKWQYERDLKMTKQEVKEEHRQQEGDPAIKGQVRKKQREMAMRRMMAEVPKATVIVTNPTHYAVALKYRVGEDHAPRLVAKGKDLVARRIREIGEEHKVPIVENPPLAQSLYRGAEVGEEIPPALFRAVAELLSYVFRLRGRL